MYALRARQDGRPDLALLFQALAESHSRQGQRFLLQARGFISDSPANIATATEEHLPYLIEAFESLAKKAGRENKRALAIGADHAARIGRMNQNLLNQLRDTPCPRDYHVCDFCGFVAPDRPPERCPICTAPRRRFIAFPWEE